MTEDREGKTPSLSIVKIQNSIFKKKSYDRPSTRYACSGQAKDAKLRRVNLDLFVIASPESAEGRSNLMFFDRINRINDILPITDHQLLIT